MQNLARTLGLKDGIALYVGVILGSGIFAAPAVVANASAHPLIASLMWLLGGVITFLGASCYAECGARLPQTGGFFIFYKEAYGPALAFTGGWVALLVTYPASIAGIALFFARYVNIALGGSMSGTHEIGIAALAILLTGALNAAGVRASALTQRVFTSVKIVALIALTLSALFGEPAHGFTATPTLFPNGFTGLLGAMVMVLWTYDGWTDVSMVTGELKDPKRDLGRTVALGTLILFALYSTVQLVVLYVLGASNAQSSQTVVADVMTHGLGARAGRLMAVLVVASTLGSFNGVILAASRLPFAMAQHGVFPRWFAQVHPRFGTPARATWVLVATTLMYVAVAPFQSLMALFTFAVWIFYSLTAVGLLRLRQRNVGDPDGFRAPLGILAPVVVVIVGVCMSGGLLIEDPKRSAWGLAVLASGFAVYALWRPKTTALPATPTT